MPVRVAAGEEVTLWASRTHDHVCVGLRAVPKEAVASSASDVVGFSLTEDERWTADFGEGASVRQLSGRCATLRQGYATAPFAPVEVEGATEHREL